MSFLQFPIWRGWGGGGGGLRAKLEPNCYYPEAITVCT